MCVLVSDNIILCFVKCATDSLRLCLLVDLFMMWSIVESTTVFCVVFVVVKLTYCVMLPLSRYSTWWFTLLSFIIIVIVIIINIDITIQVSFIVLQMLMLYSPFMCNTSSANSIISIAGIIGIAMTAGIITTIYFVIYSVNTMICIITIITTRIISRTSIAIMTSQYWCRSIAEQIGGNLILRWEWVEKTCSR